MNLLDDLEEKNKQIGIFTIDESDTTMLYGSYYQTLMDVPFDDEKRFVTFKKCSLKDEIPRRGFP